MLKVIALLTRNPNLTREQFIEHYESIHAPLILQSFPQIRKYRRNFVNLTDTRRAPGVPNPTFDVLTEMWFESRETYSEMLAAHGDPAIGGPVGADANELFDMSQTMQFMVDVRDSEL